MFSGSKLGSPVTSAVTRHQSRVYFVDCKGILTPILRTWVQKSTLLLQNRGHAEVLKKDPFFREIRNAGAPPHLSAPAGSIIYGSSHLWPFITSLLGVSSPQEDCRPQTTILSRGSYSWCTLNRDSIFV